MNIQAQLARIDRALGEHRPRSASGAPWCACEPWLAVMAGMALGAALFAAGAALA